MLYSHLSASLIPFQMIECCSISDSEGDDSDYEGETFDEDSSQDEHAKEMTPRVVSGKAKSHMNFQKAEKSPRKKKIMPLKKKAELEMTSDEDEASHRNLHEGRVSS